MAVSTTVYFSHPYQVWLRWQQFWYLYHLHARLRDLEGLIAWAKRKRLTPVRQAYLRQYQNTEDTLSSYCWSERELTLWAGEVFELVNFWFPPTYRKGHARQYRHTA